MTATPSETHEAALSDERLLWTALDETQGLLVAMLHEQRPRDEIEAQIVANRQALARRSQPSAGEVVADTATDWAKRKDDVILDYRRGNLTKLGVANSLRRAGFRLDVATQIANELPPADATPPDQSRVERLEAALKLLIRAYVSLMETGRDRIVQLGGDCDPVDVMERGDPYLRKAKEALSEQANG